MRLSDLLSKPIKEDYSQIEGFLSGKKGDLGQKVDLQVGNIALNYYCAKCEDLRTFNSKGQLSCVFVNKNMISIDCVLTCGCGETVQIWFLVEANNDITSRSPNVRIIKRCERLSSMVKINCSRYGSYSVLLDKAEQAYREGLGAGSIVYLRKILESITAQTADAVGIEYQKHKGGNPKNFSELLTKVNEQCAIIPNEFSTNSYRLFKELSEIVHGDYEEELGLRKFEPLHRLVIGILENVRNKKELQDASEMLGWERTEGD